MQTETTTRYALFSEAISPLSGRQSKHQFTKVREMTIHEYESVRSARSLLGKLANESEYTNLLGYREDLNKSVAEQLACLFNSDRDGTKNLFPQTSRRFADFLEAFKGFGERNSTWLSHEFGKGSAQLEAFRTAASFEFDASAAYRIMHGLRNVSAHGTQVINGGRIYVEGLPDGGSFEELQLNIDGPALLTEFRSRLRAATAVEIEAAPTVLDVIQLVERTLQGCGRIHATLCQSLSAEFHSALALLRDLWDEAADPATTEVWAMVEPDLSDDSSLEGMMRVRDFDFDSAAVLPGRWERILSDYQVQVSLEDVCKPSELRVYKNADGTIRD